MKPDSPCLALSGCMGQGAHPVGHTCGMGCPGIRHILPAPHPGYKNHPDHTRERRGSGKSSRLQGGHSGPCRPQTEGSFSLDPSAAASLQESALHFFATARNWEGRGKHFSCCVERWTGLWYLFSLFSCLLTPPKNISWPGGSWVAVGDRNFRYELKSSGEWRHQGFPEVGKWLGCPHWHVSPTSAIFTCPEPTAMAPSHAHLRPGGRPSTIVFMVVFCLGGHAW